MTPPPPRPESGHAAGTPDVYLLFAHEPYFPGPKTREINTTVVAAGSLLHPQVRQPDGARIHDLLTRRRQPGEIVPLATLTHELNGGALWPHVGDWEGVITDVVHLVRDGACDALSLGLPALERSLLCTGPHRLVSVRDAATGQITVFGPSDRRKVLARIDIFLTRLVTEQPLWPGEHLLPPLSPHPHPSTQENLYPATAGGDDEARQERP